jgi:ribosomal-protein-alanine N-acetyltransferase
LYFPSQHLIFNIKFDLPLLKSKVMNILIETERLIMRDLLPEDAPGMFALDSDAEVHKYIGGRPVKTIDDSRKVIEIIRAQYISNGIGRWAVIEKTTEQFIGWSGLKLITEPINGHNNYLDLGYRFMPQYWGKGYAKETAKASADFAWNTLKASRLCGIAHEQNIASRKVLESVGLQQKELFEFDAAPHVWYEMARPDDHILTA